MSRRLVVVLIVAVAGYFGWNAIKRHLTQDTVEVEIYSQMPRSRTTAEDKVKAVRQNTWEPIGGPGGGDLRSLDVALDNQKRLVFYEVLENGLFRYGKGEWTLITTSFEGQVFNDFAILVDGAGKYVLYLATSDGLFSSDDEGDHWTDLDSSAFGRRAWRVAVAHEKEGAQILVLSDEGLFRRAENGYWVKVLLSPEVVPPFRDVSLIKEPDGSFAALVAAATGVFRSELYRPRWESVNTFQGKLLRAFPQVGVEPGEAFAVTYEPHYYYWHYFHLYRSTDGGRSWFAIGGRRKSWTQGFARGWEMDMLDAADGGDYALSTDEGKSWTRIKLDNVDGARIVAISPTWQNDGRFYTATYAGQVLEVDTLEKSWRLASSAPPATCVRRLAVLNDRAGTAALIAAGKSGFYVSEDNGTSWEAIMAGLDNYDVQAIVVSPEFDKDKTILVGTDSGLYSMKWGDGTWKAVGKPMAKLQVNAITYSPAFASDRSVYAGTNQGVFRSFDGGQNWQAVAKGLDGAWVNAVLAKIEAGRLRLYAATGRGLYLSEDHGNNWQIVNDVPKLNTLTLYADENQSRIWIGNTDGLISWSPGTKAHPVRMGTSFNSVSSVLSVPPQAGMRGVLIAGTIGNGAYCSSDGGEKWIPMHSEMGHQQILDLTNSGGPVLFAGTANRGVLRYLGLPTECTIGSHP